MRVQIKVALAVLALCAAPCFAKTPASRVQSGPTPFDYAARQRQVASGDMRIPPLDPAEISDEMRALTQQTRATFQLQGKGSPTANGANYRHPSLLYDQVKLGYDLNQNGTLPAREREMAILRTSWLVRSPLEWGEHVRFGKRQGLTTEEIERITKGSSAPDWSEHDRAVLRGVEELLGDHAVSDATWAILAKSWNEQQLIELPGVVGAYTLTAMLYNSLRIGLLPTNPGFSAR